jgi:hypothetical protein
MPRYKAESIHEMLTAMRTSDLKDMLFMKCFDFRLFYNAVSITEFMYCPFITGVPVAG